MMRVGSSLFLIAIGAVLTWAVDIADSTYGSVTVDWDVVGAILMIAGAVGLCWALYVTSAWRADRNDRNRLGT